MLRPPFRDPNVLVAYIATKIGVIAIAAIATWPLARAIGPRAWIGLGVFAAVLTVMTAAVLLGGSAAPNEIDQSDDPEPEADDPGVPDQPVEIPMDDSLDLHSFPPRDIPDVVDAYLEAVSEMGFAEVRLIHGRGIGVQRDRIQKLLARHHLVAGFHDAPPDRGGWGATIAYLKKGETS